MFFFLGASFAAAFLGAAFETARVAEREVVEGVVWAGANAAVPARRVERMASFMVVVLSGGGFVVKSEDDE